ncbi:UNVERIFIED_CONTAM: hypothetical protein RMT77_002580 [Armadillidium vulgare]
MERNSPFSLCHQMWPFLLALFLFVPQLGESFQSMCQREPQSTAITKAPGDGGYRIHISGNPEKYVPGEVYTVSLQARRSQYHHAQKFVGFTLIVESASHVDHYGPQSVGTFQLYGDVLTKHSEGCPNAVTQTSKNPKSEIQVLWTSPPAGSGCLRFKATVSEQRDVWYMDDGELTKDLCEEIQESDDMVPEVIQECCACDEAKYEVTFEGLWSRQTHPKDFPANEWLTHFSDIIGASHSNDYRVWEYGGLASDGLRQVAEWGSTRVLESELKRQSDHIRTIIKARGLWYPNVNGKTFAVFRVDNRHHLMSIVSMLGPSPDWIVGVSALELCFENCTWVGQKTINLYPWDAGTDSGVTYMSANNPSVPRQKIRRITNSYPNDQKSPFYDPKGFPMKPLAKLTITRQRVYEKSCTDQHEYDDERPFHFPDETEEDRPECATSEWSQFSPCSVTCGKGLVMRMRQYRIPMKADMARCNVQLEQSELCNADVSICEGGSIDNIFAGKILEDPMCRTSEWSNWEPCSATCGNGWRTRTRRYLNRMGRKKCSKELIEKETCMADILECEQNEEKIDPACATTQWTTWSPCSVTCGIGIRTRIRYFLVPTATEASCGVKTRDKMACEGERKDCSIDEFEAKEVCVQPKYVGPCRGYFPRWYYDSEKRMCIQFIYGGCRGNRNNFQKYDECTRICEFARDEIHSESSHSNNHLLESSSSSGVDSYASNTNQLGHLGSDNNYDHGESHRSPSFSGLISESQLGPVIDCVMSEWSSDWTQCSVTCGTGWTEIRRMVKVEPQNGGKPCPRKTVRRRKCKLPKCSQSKPHSFRRRKCPKRRKGKKVKDKPNHHNLKSMSFKFEPYSEFSSPIHPSSQLHNLMPSPPFRASPVDSEEDLMKEMRETTNMDCVMGDWGPWSPCTHTCGSEALQQRVRSIVVKAKGTGIPCGPSLERRFCTLPPCPHSRG